ncbi:Gamma-tubulin complex component 4 -like protein [Halotydeus destructor]|nr:Gamma-tubulin complex component 4 -like protein [Halotydeus destructor]
MDFHVDFPLKDLLFALRGIPGDIFTVINEIKGSGDDGVPELVMSGSACRQYFHPCEVDMADDILKVASCFMVVNKFVKENALCREPYTASFAHGIKQCLVSYEAKLQELELDVYEDHLTPLSKVLSMLQFSEFLRTVCSLIAQLRSNSLSAMQLISKCSQLAMHPDSFTRVSFQSVSLQLNDTFFDALWAWLMFGSLHCQDNNFFIKEADKKAFVDSDDLPVWVTCHSAEKALFCGNLVRMFGSRQDSCFSEVHHGSEADLFEKLKAIKLKRTIEQDEFSSFVEHFRIPASRFSARYALESEHLIENFVLLKDFFLTGNENLWFCFTSKLAQLDLGSKGTEGRRHRKVKKIVHDILVDGFYRNEDAVENLLSRFKFDFEEPEPDLKTPLPIIYMDISMTPMLQKILKTDCFQEYHKLLNFLLQMYQVRNVLNEKWRQGVKDKLFYGNWFLRHKLVHFVEHLYYFFKVNIIERLSADLIDKLKKCEDYEKMSSLHTEFVNSVRRESLLHLPAVETAYFELFRICNELAACDFDSEILTKFLEDKFDPTEVAADLSQDIVDHYEELNVSHSANDALGSDVNNLLVTTKDFLAKSLGQSQESFKSVEEHDDITSKLYEKTNKVLVRLRKRSDCREQEKIHLRSSPDAHVKQVKKWLENGYRFKHERNSFRQSDPNTKARCLGCPRVFPARLLNGTLRRHLTYYEHIIKCNKYIGLGFFRACDRCKRIFVNASGLSGHCSKRHNEKV